MGFASASIGWIDDLGLAVLDLQHHHTRELVIAQWR